MNLQTVGTLLRKDLAYFGVCETAYDILLRSINRVVFLKVFQGILLEHVDLGHCALAPGMEWRLLDASQLRECATHGEYDMTEAFVDSALEKGDQCFGVFVDGVLANYSWYSSQDTEGSDGLTISFNPEYAYVYKGFTHPKYRGQHLHAIGMTLALREYLSRGYRGLVAYVESNNFSSLNSFDRLGYRDVGHVTVWKLFGRPFIVASRGCREVGLCFEPSRTDSHGGKYSASREAVPA